VNITDSETAQDVSAFYVRAEEYIMILSAHCLLYDLLYHVGQKVLFTELLSLQITDFACEIGFEEAYQNPGRGVLLLPSRFCDQQQSVPPFWGSRLQ
jgi:hypothetical protein